MRKETTPERFNAVLCVADKEDRNIYEVIYGGRPWDMLVPKHGNFPQFEYIGADPMAQYSIPYGDGLHAGNLFFRNLSAGDREALVVGITAMFYEEARSVVSDAMLAMAGLDGGGRPVVRSLVWDGGDWHYMADMPRKEQDAWKTFADRKTMDRARKTCREIEERRGDAIEAFCGWLRDRLDGQVADDIFSLGMKVAMARCKERHGEGPLGIGEEVIADAIRYPSAWEWDNIILPCVLQVSTHARVWRATRNRGVSAHRQRSFNSRARMARDVGSLSPSPDSLTHVLGEAVVPVSLRMTENQRTGLTISIIVTCQRIAGFQNTAWKTALAASGGMPQLLSHHPPRRHLPLEGRMRPRRTHE